MKKALLACLALVPLLLAACGSGARETARSDMESDTVRVENGALVVALEGNPTTGYEWILESEPTCLSAPEREYEQYPALELTAGTGGVFTFRFAPVAPGEQTLRFVYERSWDGDSTIDEYTITVTVTETAAGYEMVWE